MDEHDEPVPARPSRFRFTVRRLSALVAVVALVLGAGVGLSRLYEDRFNTVKRLIDNFGAVRNHTQDVGDLALPAETP